MRSDFLAFLDSVRASPTAADRFTGSNFFYVDLAARRHHVSRLLRNCGFRPEDLANDVFPEYLHHDDRDAYRSMLGRLLLGEDEQFVAEYRARCRDGRWQWIQTIAIVLERDLTGAPILLMGVDVDIHARKEHEKTMMDKARTQSSQEIEKARTLVQVSAQIVGSPEAIRQPSRVLERARNLFEYDLLVLSVVEDGTPRIIGTDPAGREAEAEKWSSAGVIVSRPYPNIRTLADDAPWASWLGVPVIDDRQTVGVLEVFKSGKNTLHSEDAWPLRGFADNLAGVIRSARDWEALEDEASRDALTGLYNRRHLERAFQQMFAQNAGETLTLIEIDIDHFKQFNDDFGHDLGDDALKAVADQMRVRFRDSDLLFRLGGEELAVLMPGTALPAAYEAAERFRVEVSRVRFPGVDREVTVSCGVASLTTRLNLRGAAAWESLYKYADDALYRAKTGGRNQVVIAR